LPVKIRSAQCGSRAIDRLGDRPARAFPAPFVTSETGLRPRVVACQVRGLEDSGHPVEPASIVDLAPRTRRRELVGGALQLPH
jgi:hypothetical protein